MDNRISNFNEVNSSALGYLGDVSPKEAWEILQNDKNAVLVDVRTKEEWHAIGIPDLSSLSRDAVFISWRVYPDMNVNENFVAEFAKQVTDKNTILFLCKSGGRSKEAALAMTRSGYSKCYNITGGFEGNIMLGKNGWKQCNLASKQG